MTKKTISTKTINTPLSVNKIKDEVKNEIGDIKNTIENLTKKMEDLNDTDVIDMDADGIITLQEREAAIYLKKQKAQIYICYIAMSVASLMGLLITIAPIFVDEYAKRIEGYESLIGTIIVGLLGMVGAILGIKTMFEAKNGGH